MGYERTAGSTTGCARCAGRCRFVGPVICLLRDVWASLVGHPLATAERFPIHYLPRRCASSNGKGLMIYFWGYTFWRLISAYPWNFFLSAGKHWPFTEGREWSLMCGPRVVHFFNLCASVVPLLDDHSMNTGVVWLKQNGEVGAAVNKFYPQKHSETVLGIIL